MSLATYPLTHRWDSLFEGGKTTCFEKLHLGLPTVKSAYPLGFFIGKASE